MTEIASEASGNVCKFGYDSGPIAERKSAVPMNVSFEKVRGGQ